MKPCEIVTFSLDFAALNLADPWPRISTPNRKQRFAESPKGRYVVIAPGAAASRRVWPADRLASLAARMVRETSLQVVLTGSFSELRLVNEVERLCAAPVLNLAGKLTVTELLSVLGKAKLILTNETGMAHLGAAFRVPTVCITGGGHFARFVPYPNEAAGAGIRLFPVYHEMPCFGCNWRCIYDVQAGQAVPCISNVGRLTPYGKSSKKRPRLRTDLGDVQYRTMSKSRPYGHRSCVTTAQMIREPE